MTSGKSSGLAAYCYHARPERTASRRTIQHGTHIRSQKARVVRALEPNGQTDAAIRRACGKEAANYQEILYEGYAPHGVALLVETATDNPTRTVGSVRNIFAKGGGNLATAGSVSFLFKKMGVFRLEPSSVKDQDELELDL